MLTNALGEDRRLFERFNARFPAKIQDSRDSYGTNLYVRDASGTGARLASKERLFVNDSVNIEVKLPDSPNPFIMRGQVKWARFRNNNLWDIGIKYHRVRLMHASRIYRALESWASQAAA